LVSELANRQTILDSIKNGLVALLSGGAQRIPSPDLDQCTLLEGVEWKLLVKKLQSLIQ
jgi:hypothetical protein